MKIHDLDPVMFQPFSMSFLYYCFVLYVDKNRLTSSGNSFQEIILKVDMDSWNAPPKKLEKYLMDIDGNS